MYIPGVYRATGVCEDFDGTLACVANGGNGGGLDGISMDACGYVYVTEYIAGKVYRFTPEGGVGDLAATLPSSWIPNLHWGTGVGGFDTHVMYVADRDLSGLYALDVGVPDAREVFPKGAP